MTVTSLVLAFAFVVNSTLGIAVLINNRTRMQNRWFFVFASLFSLWSLIMLVIINTAAAPVAAGFIRAAAYLTVLIPVAFLMLCLTIAHPAESRGRLLKRGRWWFLLSQLAGLICLTPAYLRDLKLTPVPGRTGLRPEPEYGPGFGIVALYYLVVIGWILYYSIRRLKEARRVRKLELQFVLAGMGTTIGIAIVTNVALPLATGNPDYQQLGPISTLAMNVIIAYGIATHRLMEVRRLLRLATAYALLAVYLGVLYALVWWPAQAAVALVAPQATALPHLLAALAMALSVAPAHGRLQGFTNRLFINLPQTDVGLTVDRTSEVLRSIGTLSDLLRPFSDTVADSVGTDSVRILLSHGGAFSEVLPAAPGEEPLSVPEGDALVRALRGTREPLVAELVQRLPPERRPPDALSRLKALDAEVAVAIRSKGQLIGIMLLGPRLSDRIYGDVESKALRIVADQLAVAVENAKLYTELQNRKIYNEALLENLVSGVVAVDRNRRVTVFNREAQRITGLRPQEVLGQPAQRLPAGLYARIGQAFAAGAGERNIELSIPRPPGDDVPLQLGSSVLKGEDGGVSGVLLVFTDLTVVKRLETELRRSAHLASLGTLSAGMAHEIKNPLVTLKTFSQLLTERYQDADFRETFSSLVDKEVNRIDRIVNQLLDFGRPAKPALRPISIGATLRHAVLLVRAQLERRGIALQSDFTPEPDTVEGDANLLEQAFVNLFLNAIDTMKGGGKLGVSTSVYRPHAVPPGGGDVWTGPHATVRVSDTGQGIRPSDLPRIFDPFFSTKSHGTGMGLSVAHGIIREHNGIIDVESREGQGTTFFILLPLSDREAAAD